MRGHERKASLALTTEATLRRLRTVYNDKKEREKVSGELPLHAELPSVSLLREALRLTTHFPFTMLATPLLDMQQVLLHISFHMYLNHTLLLAFCSLALSYNTQFEGLLLLLYTICFAYSPFSFFLHSASTRANACYRLRKANPHFTLPIAMSTFAKYFLACVAVAAVFLASAAVALSVTERVPDGTYCGNYGGGLVVGNVTTQTGSDKFDMIMVGLGLDMTCENETFIYDPTTHHAKVPGATDPHDCLGSVLTDGGLTLDVLYKPDVDQLILDLGFTKINCKKCSKYGLAVRF